MTKFMNIILENIYSVTSIFGVYIYPQWTRNRFISSIYFFKILFSKFVILKRLFIGMQTFTQKQISLADFFCSSLLAKLKNQVRIFRLHFQHKQYLILQIILINMLFFPFKKNNYIQKSPILRENNKEIICPQTTAKMTNKILKQVAFLQQKDEISQQFKTCSTEKFTKYLINRPTYKQNTMKNSQMNDQKKLRKDNLGFSQYITPEKKISLTKFSNFETLNIKKEENPQTKKLKKISRLTIVKLKKQNIDPIQNFKQQKFIKSSTQQNIKTQITFDISKRYEIIDVLGKGAYGIVKKCEDKFTKKKYAIKQFFMNKHNEIKIKSNILREIKILSKLNHPSIMKYQDFFYSEKIYYLVMEYCGDRNLKLYLKQNRRIPESIAKKIFHNIVVALQYLHQNQVVHRDIKLDNIMIDHQFNIKFIDFGFSLNIQNQNQLLNNYCGTPSYMSPQIIQKIPYNPYKADIWAIGICLHKMITGKYPFPNREQKSVLDCIAKGQIKVQDWLSKQVKNLLKKILMMDAANRISLKSILQDEWILN